MFLRNIGAVDSWRTDTIQTHSRLVSPSLFVIPELDGFEGAFPEEVDHVVPSPGGDPVADDQFLGGAIIEVNDEAVKEDSLAANPQLNGAKVNITTGDLNPAMILTAIDLRVAQEVPKLSTGG